MRDYGAYCLNINEVNQRADTRLINVYITFIIIYFKSGSMAYKNKTQRREDRQEYTEYMQ